MAAIWINLELGDFTPMTVRSVSSCNASSSSCLSTVVKLKHVLFSKAFVANAPSIVMAVLKTYCNAFLNYGICVARHAHAPACSALKQTLNSDQTVVRCVIFHQKLDCTRSTTTLVPGRRSRIEEPQASPTQVLPDQKRKEPKVGERQ